MKLLMVMVAFVEVAVVAVVEDVEERAAGTIGLVTEEGRMAAVVPVSRGLLLMEGRRLLEVEETIVEDTLTQGVGGDVLQAFTHPLIRLVLP
jgi:hypothetical protein